ncbi:MAG: hypothetical protein LBP63_00395 [Prevotellaceae bacterium]|jgi:hypothetical protein|nr:hypothetical protein [Prevotellaceae bacterium]
MVKPYFHLILFTFLDWLRRATLRFGCFATLAMTRCVVDSSLLRRYAPRNPEFYVFITFYFQLIFSGLLVISYLFFIT